MSARYLMRRGGISGKEKNNRKGNKGWGGVEGDEGEKMNIVKKKIIQSGLLRSLLMVRLFNAIP